MNDSFSVHPISIDENNNDVYYIAKYKPSGFCFKIRAIPNTEEAFMMNFSHIEEPPPLSLESLIAIIWLELRDLDYQLKTTPEELILL